MQNINHIFNIACIENINSKRSKKRSGKIEKFFGYEIKVKTECNSTFLRMLAHGELPDYDTFFFNEDGTLKASYVSSLTISRTIEDHRILIDLDLATENSMRFLHVVIPEFKILPVMGFEYLVRFTVRIKTTDDELLFLNQAVQQEQVIFSIEEPPKIGAIFDEDSGVGYE